MTDNFLSLNIVSPHQNVNKMNLINFLYVTPLHSIAGMVEKEIKMWVGAFH
jgi:hypothetical protein